jgi:ATP synthase protein I
MGNAANQPGAGNQGPGAGAYASFGLQFVVALLVFLWLGQWLDRRLGTAPVFLLVGVFAGAGGSFYAMYRKLMAAQEREEQATKARRAERDAGARKEP